MQNDTPRLTLHSEAVYLVALLMLSLRSPC